MSLRNKKRSNTGFTLAEFLIVVAIIGVLTAIVFAFVGDKVEKAREAKDAALMRQAKSEIIMKYMDGDIIADGNTIYFYNPNGSMSTVRPSEGYGSARNNCSEWWTGSDFAFGKPNLNGAPAFLGLTMDSNGQVSFTWGGVFLGQNITTPAQYNALSDDEKLEKDVLLVDGLQDIIRNMTYGQMRDLLFDDKGKLRSGLKTGTIDGTMCVVLAYGTIDSAGETITGANRTKLFLDSLFEEVGYNIDLPDDEKYIIHSVQKSDGNADGTQTIWVNLRVTKDELMNAVNSGKKLTKSYTYVKGGGEATPNPLKEQTRRTPK